MHTSSMNYADRSIRQRTKAEKRNQQKFFDLAERFRNATNPTEAKRLGDQLGRMIFGR